MKDNLTLLQLFTILTNLSENTYLVGGAVRDSILGNHPKDFDLATDIPMEKSRKELEENGWKVKEAGEHFMVLIASKNDQQFEVANFRKDGIYLDGRRPESVEIGTIEEDAVRRDFTVNALYLNPITGKLLDPTGKGLQDCNNRVLRFIGKPRDRILEDRLRVFRFYRFLTKGFNPEKHSLKACRQYFNDAYENSTAERVRMEIERMSGLV